MMSLIQCRAIDPRLVAVSDAELSEIRDTLYLLGELALECWMNEQKEMFPTSHLVSMQES